MATQTKVEYKYFEPKADEILRNKAAEKIVSNAYQYVGVQIDEEDDTETISSDVFRVSQKCPTIHSIIIIKKRLNKKTNEKQAISW